MAAEKATRRTTSIAISIGKSDPVPGLLAPWARSQAVAMHHLCCLLLAIAVLFRPLRLRTWIPCFMTAAQTPANRTLAMKHCCRCLNAPAVPGVPEAEHSAPVPKGPKSGSWRFQPFGSCPASCVVLLRATTGHAHQAWRFARTLQSLNDAELGL